MIDKKLAKNLHTIILNEYENTEGIVILKAGEIVFEEYFGNTNRKSKLHIASVTKSILSALIGIAVEKGYIKSTEETVMGYFPEYNFISSNGVRENVTIQNLLTMTAPYSFDDWNEPLEALCTSPDWIKFSLQEMGQYGEIGTFKYSTAGAHLLSAILTRVAGKSTREFANEFLFTQIGIDRINEYPMSSYGYDVTTYQKTKPLYDAYRKAKDKGQFKADHERGIILHEAAARALQAAQIGRKLPSVAALQAEYEKLQGQKEALYSDYGKLKKQVREYDVIRQNIDSILQRERQPEKERQTERE